MTFFVTNVGIRLYFYAGKIAHFSYAHEKFDKTYCLQQLACNGPHACM